MGFPVGQGQRDRDSGAYGDTPQDDPYTLVKRVLKLKNPDQAAIAAEIAKFKAECPWHAQLGPHGNRPYLQEAIKGSVQQSPTRVADMVALAQGLGLTKLAAELGGGSTEEFHRPVASGGVPGAPGGIVNDKFVP